MHYHHIRTYILFVYIHKCDVRVYVTLYIYVRTIPIHFGYKTTTSTYQSQKQKPRKKSEPLATGFANATMGKEMGNREESEGQPGRWTKKVNEFYVGSWMEYLLQIFCFVGPNPALAVPSKWTNNKMSWECGEKKGATSVRPESERPWTRDELNTEHAHRHTRTQWHILRACTSELNIVWYWTSYLQAIRKGGGVERRAGHRMMMMMTTTRTTTATMVDSDYRVVCPAPALAIYAMSVLCCGNRNNCTQRLGAHNARQMVEERQI